MGAQEQRDTEQTLHLIMVSLSWLTSFCFLMSGVYPRTFVPFVMGNIGMLVKGLWFFVISDVLYSGKWGDVGINYMPAMAYVVAGMILMLVSATVGCCLFCRPSGYYDDVESWEEEVRG